MIYTNKNNELFECHQWDGTADGMLRICRELPGIGGFLPTQSSVCELFLTGCRLDSVRIGEMTEGDWVIKNITTGDTKVMTCAEVSEQLEPVISGEHQGISYSDLWKDMDGAVAMFKELADDHGMAEDSTAVEPSIRMCILQIQAMTYVALQKLKERESLDREPAEKTSYPTQGRGVKEAHGLCGDDTRLILGMVSISRQINENDKGDIMTVVVTNQNLGDIRGGIISRNSLSSLHEYEVDKPEIIAGYVVNNYSFTHFILDECCVGTPFVDVCESYAAMGARLSIVKDGKIVDVD